MKTLYLSELKYQNKGWVIVSLFWTKVFSLGKARAITLFPFIFLRHARDLDDPVLLNHERIHIRQAVELLIVPFYICYLLEFVVRLIQYRAFHRAYRNISFEREAYAHQHDPGYLERRSLWGFVSFLSGQ